MSFSFISAATCAGVVFVLAAVGVDVACCALGIKYLVGSQRCATGTTQNNFVWWVTVYSGLQLLATLTNHNDTVIMLLARAACSLVIGAVAAGVALMASDSGAGCNTRDEVLQLYAFGNIVIGVLALCIGAVLSCHCVRKDEEDSAEYDELPAATTAFTRVV